MASSTHIWAETENQSTRGHMWPRSQRPSTCCAWPHETTLPVSSLPSLHFITTCMCLIIIWKKKRLLNQIAIQCTPPYDYYPFRFRTETLLCAVSCCGAQFVGSSPWKGPKQNPDMTGIQAIIVLTKNTTSKHWVCITSAHLGPSANNTGPE